MPSLNVIAKWWCSADGQARIRQINDRHGIDLGASLGSSDLDTAHCWACNQAPSGGRKRYQDSFMGLERCHVIPSGLGGSNEPSNLVVMCSKCHSDNPDTADESAFWWWFDRVESSVARSVRALADLIPKDITSKEAEKILSKVEHICKSGQAVQVSGKLSTGSLQAIVYQAVRECRA